MSGVNVSDWDKVIYDFGDAKSNTDIDVTFTYWGSESIDSVRPSCGCTVANVNNSKVHVTYSIGPFPEVLRAKGVSSRPVSKQVLVTLGDGTIVNLMIRGEQHDL